MKKFLQLCADKKDYIQPSEIDIALVDKISNWILQNSSSESLMNVWNLCLALLQAAGHQSKFKLKSNFFSNSF